jgi:hypothetical protein
VFLAGASGETVAVIQSFAAGAILSLWLPQCCPRRTRKEVRWWGGHHSRLLRGLPVEPLGVGTLLTELPRRDLLGSSKVCDTEGPVGLRWPLS